MTEVVIVRTWELCEKCIDPERFRSIVAAAVAAGDRADGREDRPAVLHARIDGMMVRLDRMYMDRLSGLLADADLDASTGTSKRSGRRWRKS